MESLKDKLVAQYQQKLAQGMCAHAVWALIICFASMCAKEEGLTQQESFTLIREIAHEIKALQEAN